METFSQMLTHDNAVQLGTVEDDPIVSYRGIMIDPVRHFLGVGAIKNLVTTMPLAKLNMLHWSFTNDEAFTLNLGSHPELSEAGRYSEAESYTPSQVKDVIALGKLNAVSIIPEINTPAHVRSWGLSKQWQAKNITILCGGG
jgi:hexosaminidase